MTTPLLIGTLAVRAIQFQPRLNISAVVGGVLGGVAINIILVYLVWRFCLKGRTWPVHQDVEYEASDYAEVGDYEDEREELVRIPSMDTIESRQSMDTAMETMRNPSSMRWSKRTMETRWSSIRTESTRLSSLRFDRFSLKGLPPVPIILKRDWESGR